MPDTLAAPRPFTPHDRRIALAGAGLSARLVGLAVGAHRRTVIRVVNGRSLQGPSADAIAAYIAGALGKPLELVFPELGERRHSPDRRED
jgi:hypothetical protein